MKRYNKQVHWFGSKKSNITKMHGQQYTRYHKSSTYWRWWRITHREIALA